MLREAAESALCTRYAFTKVPAVEECDATKAK